MSTSDDVTGRVQELELRFMAQQRLIEELSDVVAEQAKQIDALERALRRLRDKLPEPGLVDAESDEKPPHY